MPYFIRPFAKFDPQAFSVVITCADGLENALLTELTSFGLTGEQIRTGRVRVLVSLAKFYHICLYSRVASRVLLPIGEYHFRQKAQTISQVRETEGKKATRRIQTKVVDEDVPAALYEFTSRFDWTNIFGVDNTFAIRLSVDKRLAVNQQFATLRIKDAVADCFNQTLGKRPNVDKSPDFYIYAHASHELFELYLDLSGTSLHHRGYRVANTDAPLKENLAAALLYECGWHTNKHTAIIDPMCGSGTFLTEALLMRIAYPVGIDKKTNEFGFYAWAFHDDKLWEETANHALNQFHDNLATLEKEFINGSFSALAMDANAQTIKACHKNLMASALVPIAHHITLEQRPLAQAGAVLKSVCQNKTTDYPLIITNPPYGERLGERDFIKPLYQGLGLLVADSLRDTCHTADLAVLASHVEHADTLPMIDPKTLKCHNGALGVYFRYGKVDFDKTDVIKSSLIVNFNKQELNNADAQEFINRLQKNSSHLKKLASKHRVTNVRLYDADLPNFNVAIDVYGDKIHVQEYAAPKQIPSDVAKARFNLVLSVIRQIFHVNRESIFIKTRMRQSGNDQYTKNSKDDNQKSKKMYVAYEHGAYLYVNFTEYLDTGLFIDHRNMREMIKNASRGKNVLNLFAYTCTASVHAALGGAKSVTSVDLSANYLNWGKQNFALNGLDLQALKSDGVDKYQFIATDVFEWLKNNTEQYDVIFIDPPTFSNSKKFYGTFDVQRDHVALINRAMNRLTPNGVLYFSNNFTKFSLDDELNTRYEVACITDKTIGFDFNPKKPIHQSFVIRHKNAKKADAHDDSRMTHEMPSPVKQNQAKQDKKPSDTKDKPYPKSITKKDTHKVNKTKKSGMQQDGLTKYGKKADKTTHLKTKRFDERDKPPKPTQKIRYDKIDGKMVATVLNDEMAIEPTPKKYQLKKSGQ